MSNSYEWTPEMGEISGFGGGYEETCRRMLRAGMAWLDERPEAEPEFHSYEGVFGLIIGNNEDAKALSKAILDSAEDCTGAMHQAVIGACLFIRKNGWPEYVKQMTERNKA